MEKKTNVVCPACTCLCDDIEVSEADRALTIKNACAIGERWFSTSVADTKHRVAAEAVELNEAIQAAKKLIENSIAPLIFGLDHLSTAAQQSAWRLADRMHATIDTTLLNSGRASTFALQKIGKVTATLGEVATRSDLVLFWFCDPATTHPRHLERYSAPSKGNRRTIIVVDERKTATAESADRFIQLNRDQATIALASMRSVVTNENRGALHSVRQNAAWKELASQLMDARYGAVFYGHPSHDSQFDYGTESLAALIRELNQKTRTVALSLRNDANCQSAENVIGWSSGFPFAVNYNRRFPRSCWLEYSAESILARGECDLVLIASTGGLPAALSTLPTPARNHLEQTPKIVIAETAGAIIPNTAVQFSVGRPGFNDVGDFCRQDNVSLRLTAVQQPSEIISAVDVFNWLQP